METADVVIVGAGTNGASAAFHLAKAGVKKIVIVERRYLGDIKVGTFPDERLCCQLI